MLSKQDIKDLVGEMSDEKIEALDRIPSWEEIYGKSVADGIIKRLVEGGVITNKSRADLVIKHPNVSCKMLFVCNSAQDAETLVGSKGSWLKLSNKWSYTNLGNSKVMIEFAIK